MVVNRIIREIADERRFSVLDISRLTGYSEQRIFDIMYHNSSATPSEAFSICEMLGVDLKTLLMTY